MKSLKHLSAILLSVSLLSISATQADDVVVVINGKSIDNKTFSSYVAMRAQQVQHTGTLTQEQRGLLLQDFINSELLYNAALSDGIDQLPEVKAEIEVQTRALVINSGIKKHLDNTLTEALLMKTYNEQYSTNSAEYHIRHILVEHETEASSIIAALKRGEDFKKLAGISSIDPSSSDGGSLGWMGSDIMPTEFKAVVETLKAGEYSTQPVKSSFGWHIIQLDEKRTIAAPPIETVANKLAESLQGKVVQEYIEGLRNKATIEIK